MLLLGQMLYSIPTNNITVWRVFCAVSLCTYHIYIYLCCKFIFSELMLHVCLFSTIQLRRYFVSYGHDVSFTLALMKTWRIHYIFCKPSPNKKVSIFYCQMNRIIAYTIGDVMWYSQKHFYPCILVIMHLRIFLLTGSSAFQIFISPQAPKDWHLLLLVVTIVSIDIFIGLALLIPDIYFSSVGIQNDKESSPYKNVCYTLLLSLVCIWLQFLCLTV